MLCRAGPGKHYQVRTQGLCPIPSPRWLTCKDGGQYTCLVWLGDILGEGQCPAGSKVWLDAKLIHEVLGLDSWQCWIDLTTVFFSSVHTYFFLQLCKLETWKFFLDFRFYPCKDYGWNQCHSWLLEGQKALFLSVIWRSVGKCSDFLGLSEGGAGGSRESRGGEGYTPGLEAILLPAVWFWAIQCLRQSFVSSTEKWRQ